MVEGDPNIVDWQAWDSFKDEPKVPQGLTAGGPWFPFAVTSDNNVLWRRPLIRKDDDSIAATAWRGDPRE